MTHEEFLRFKEDGELLRSRTQLFLESLEKELNKKREKYDTIRTSLHPRTSEAPERARM